MVPVPHAEIGHRLRCHLRIDRRLHTAAESPQITVLIQFKLPGSCGKLQPVLPGVFRQVVFPLREGGFDGDAQLCLREIPRVIRCHAVCVVEPDLCALALRAAGHAEVLPCRIPQHVPRPCVVLRRRCRHHGEGCRCEHSSVPAKQLLFLHSHSFRLVKISKSNIFIIAQKLYECNSFFLILKCFL